MSGNRRRPGSPNRHDHLWSLPDGTGLHAPIGRLVHDGDDKICCHLCGRWFAALATHLRSHGYTTQTYREAMGLGVTTPLVARLVDQQLRRGEPKRDHPRERGDDAASPGGWQAS